MPLKYYSRDSYPSHHLHAYIHVRSLKDSKTSSMSMHISQKEPVFKNDTGHYVKINTFQFVINKVCVVSGPDTVCLYGFSICSLFSCFPNELSLLTVFLVIRTCMSRLHISQKMLLE